MSNLNANGWTDEDIEEAGVGAVSELCRINKLLTSHIATFDKVKSFDGNIELYNNEEKKTENLENIISVQVKGSNQQSLYKSKKVTFDLEKKHLENYKLTNGILFFYVLTNKDLLKPKIFYYELYPDVIRDLLSNMKNSLPDSHKTIHLKEIYGKNIKEKSNNLYKVIKRFSDRQKRLFIDLNFPKIKLSEINQFNLSSPSIHFYINKDYKIENLECFACDNFGRKIPLIDDSIESLIKIGNVNILIGNKHTFNNVSKYINLKTEIPECIIKIGKNENIIIKNIEEINYEINPNFKLLDIFEDLSLIKDILNNELVIKQKGEKDIKRVFNHKLDKDFANLYDDLNNIIKLNKDVLIPLEHFKLREYPGILKFLLKLNNQKSKNANIIMSNIYEYIYPVLNINNKYIFLNNANIVFLKEENGNQYIVPKYSYFAASKLKKLFITEEMLLEDLRYINFSNIKHIYNELCHYIAKLNWCFDITKDYKFLNTSIYLCNLLCMDNNENNFLLYIQTLNRDKNFKLEKFQIQRLNFIIDTTSSLENKLLCYILLKDKINAKKIIRTLTKKKYMEFKRLGFIRYYNDLYKI